MNRISWVDRAKYISMMIVILGHLESCCDELSCFLVTFMLPMFFFTAGYTHRCGQSFGKFMLKKFKTLLIPWLVFGLFDIFVSQIASFKQHDLLLELRLNFLQVRGFNDKLWFVAAIFIAYIPFYFFVEWYERKNARLQKHRAGIFTLISLALFCLSLVYSRTMNPYLLPWGTTALPWHIDYMFIGMFYMFFGYLFRHKYEASFDKLNTRRNRILWIAFYSVLVYAPYFVNIHDEVFYVMAKFIVPVSGVLMCVAISKVLPESRYMSYIGQNTLIYFGLHGKVFGLIEGLLRMFVSGPYTAILSNKIISSIFAIAFTLVLSFILIIPSYIINRWFPFVLGRSFKKQPKLAK